MASISPAATAPLTAQTLAALYTAGSSTAANANTFAAALQGSRPTPPAEGQQASGARPPEEVVQALDSFAEKVAGGSATEEDRQALLTTLAEAGRRTSGALMDQAA